ncbi:hypothetical protein ACHAXA_008697 [Cyclostephanos tholiformis]|uniref:CSD domain-containing protein n=1 Tax=Cyclostephanos tholiformis TaxID=382380 RepID=A0ABD3R1Q7_9STRA
MFNLIARRAPAACRFVASSSAVAGPNVHPSTLTMLTMRASPFSDHPSSSGEKVRGVVKWFDAKKGFGFITPEDGSIDLFVHHSSIHAAGFRSLGDGESVEFDTKAINVTGPDGGYVQGTPRRMDDGYGGGGYGGGGGRGGGGYGGGGNRGGGGGGYGRNDDGYGGGGGY